MTPPVKALPVGIAHEAGSAFTGGVCAAYGTDAAGKGAAGFVGDIGREGDDVMGDASDGAEDLAGQGEDAADGGAEGVGGRRVEYLEADGACYRSVRFCILLLRDREQGYVTAQLFLICVGYSFELELVV